MQIFSRVGICFLILAMAVSICTAQDVAVGTPALASLGGGPDNINLGNLNASWVIPILNNPGRGLNMSYNLAYDSSIWYPVTSGSSKAWQPVPSSNFGWQGLNPANVGNVSYYSQYISQNCGPSGHYQIWAMGNFVYTDQNGTSHNIPGSGNYTITTGGLGCPSNGGPAPTGTTQSTATDGSGLTGYYTIGQGYITMYLVTSSNEVLYPSLNGVPSSTPPVTDSNGNRITLSNGTFTDTLGNASLKVTGQAPETDVSYLTPAGTYATYKVTYKQYNIHTYFQCSGINEYTATSVYLVDKVTLPDSTYYQFGYEQTFDPSYPGYYSGRVASVTLPTGGTVTYGYTGGSHGIECMDGSTSGLTRTLSPGGTWTYSRSLVSGTVPAGSTWTTTTTDPAGNQTVTNFAEDAAANSTFNLYPTQQQFYQGTTSGSLLLTKVTCYNAHYTTCATSTVSSPITQVDTYSVLPNNSTSLSERQYSSLGQVTQDKEYDFGVTQGAAPGNTHLIRQTIINWASFGKPNSVVVNDWTSGASVQLSSTTYSYDQTAVTGTTGTPQHVSVTGSRGNLTTLAQVANASTTLYQTFSYYDTGNLNTSTGLSTSSTSPGPTTTYLYGTGSCGNSFATQINEPLSLSRSFTWNCTGGVQTQVTDENGKTLTTNYTDSEFWRPASMSDQANNSTVYSYSGQTQAGSTMTFNSNQSVSGKLATVDGLGRPILNQILQGPGASNYDTTETDYNNVGLASRFTMPFSATAGGTSSSAPGVTVSSYDALGRPLQLSVSGGGAVTYSYTNNDILQTTSGPQSFRKQFEYDGLGRLTSVCEVSSTLSGVGTCAQTVTQTGYWTKYSYDALNHLLSVTQNAQAVSGSQQHRSYAYDQLGRLTSESNPEANNTGSNGTTSYTYDVACTTTAASPGDLTKKVDNANNSTCFGYDSLHRPNAQGWNTVCRFFNYDTNVTPPSGVTVQNTKTRLLEAYTTNCGSTQYTDEWFSYSPRGELTDLYEKTRNSGSTYYHTTTAYWPNGTLQTLSGIPSVPTLYYGASNNGGAGLDSEGRLTQVLAGSGQNPVTAVTYSTRSDLNYLGALTGVTYGSLDADAFTYDSNTGRPGSYTFSINGQTDVGTLNWNSNGTLATLGIADSISGTSDSQSCTASYDDLGRLAGFNCASKGSQTFSYDPFGDISKTANGLGLSFLPTSYNANNQPVVSGMSFDTVGNTKTDNVGNSYTWDPNWGNMTSVNSTTATYDALGRVVEQQTGSSYTQILYSPIGKIALMSGSSLVKAFVPLPGGGTAMYNPSGLAYYRHPDWLGSSRLTSTSGRGMYSSGAYAPFGEQYGLSGSSDPSFTGQNSDTVPSLYDFLFRRQSSSQGRWISPDPLGIGAVDITNPQTFNRYSYVQNAPLSFVDPLGFVGSVPGDPGSGGGGDPGNPFMPPGDPGTCGGATSGGGGGGGDDWGNWGDGGDPFPPEVPIPKGLSLSGHFGIRSMGQNSCSKSGGGPSPNPGGKNAPNNGQQNPCGTSCHAPNRPKGYTPPASKDVFNNCQKAGLLSMMFGWMAGPWFEGPLGVAVWGGTNAGGTAVTLGCINN